MSDEFWNTFGAMSAYVVVLFITFGLPLLIKIGDFLTKRKRRKLAREKLKGGANAN